MAALNFLFIQKGGAWEFSASKPAERFREMSTGYGLELALNYKIKDSVFLSASEALFELKPACRKGREIQLRQLRATVNMIDWRTKHVDFLRTARRVAEREQIVDAVKKQPQKKLAVAA